MILDLERGLAFLPVGKPFKAYFKTKNIDPQKFIISGPGIRVNQTDKNGVRFTITPIEKTLPGEKLKIQVSEGVDPDTYFKHTFLVPVSIATEYETHSNKTVYALRVHKSIKFEPIKALFRLFCLVMLCNLSVVSFQIYFYNLIQNRLCL